MQKLYEEPTVYEHILREDENQAKGAAKINLKKEVNYASSEEKWDIIEKFFKTVYKSELKSYKEFMKHYFQSQVSAPKSKI
jgi:hypothetical protein